MQPIHELLSRIRWDRKFGRGSFEIGYLDRVEEQIIRIPFDEIIQAPGNSFSFQIIDRDGVLIWQRQP